MIAGKPGGYRILAGFPPQSNQPKWDHTFNLDLANNLYIFKTDYCLWTEDTCEFLCRKAKSSLPLLCIWH